MPGSSYPRIFDFMHCVCVKAWLATTNVLVHCEREQAKAHHTVFQYIVHQEYLRIFFYGLPKLNHGDE